MVEQVEHVVAVPLDQAIIDTVCTDCRMALHKLRMLLENAEASDLEGRIDRVYRVVVRVYRALHRLEANVHVCPRSGDDAPE